MLIKAPGLGRNRNIVSTFFDTKLCSVFSLKSPHRGDSNVYTQYNTFLLKKKFTLNYPKPTAMGFCSKGWMDDLRFYVLFNSISVISG